MKVAVLIVPVTYASLTFNIHRLGYSPGNHPYNILECETSNKLSYVTNNPEPKKKWTIITVDTH